MFFELRSFPQHFVVVKSFASNSAVVVAGSSAVLSNRQRLHAGEAVVVLGQDDGVPVQADFTQARSQVVGVVGLAEGVFVDFGDVVVLRNKRKKKRRYFKREHQK